MYEYFIWPYLWLSGQSSWLQIQRLEFNSQRYQIFWEVVGLERVSLSLVSTIKSCLEKRVTAAVYKNENTAGEIRCVDHIALTILKNRH
jgi:hypothetical protein